MRKTLLGLSLLMLALAGCTKEMTDVTPSEDGLVFTAGIGGRTKTSLGDAGKVCWTDGDEISINGTVFVGKADTSDPTLATFTKKNSSDPTPSAPYKAYYPADIYDGTTAELPNSLKYEAGSISNAPMYAESSTTALSFGNLCSLIGITLKGTATVTSIEVTAEETGLSGAFTVSGGAAVLSDAAKSAKYGVTLDCGAGVALSSEGKTFYVAVPAGSETLTFKVKDNNGQVATKTTKSVVTTAAGTLYPFTWEPAPSFVKNYLCFTANEDGASVILSRGETNPAYANTIEYSHDLVNWNSAKFTTNNVISGTDDTTGEIELTKKGDKVYFRNARPADEVEGFSKGVKSYLQFYINGSVSASGNIMSLVDKDCKSMKIPSGGCFYKLFRECSGLISAPELPATELTDFCYQSMFIGCTALTQVPALPATVLKSHCYDSMFHSCENLTLVPDLPASTLAEYCCSGMFNGCDKLTKAPALPATTLAANCYSYMFELCSSLTQAPELPARVLAEKCYSNMFAICTSLTTAPVLPAENLAEGCYEGMFSQCSALRAAPALPATTLAVNCYAGMFQQCTFSDAPTLNATILKEKCYFNMFAFCKNLNKVPALPATSLARMCYSQMFYYCSGLQTAPALEAMTLAEGCYASMFWGCTALTKAPALPATTLAKSCYAGMFYGCSEIAELNVAFTDWGLDVDQNTLLWVDGVSSTGTFTCPTGLDTSTSDTSHVPSGWTVNKL